MKTPSEPVLAVDECCAVFELAWPRLHEKQVHVFAQPFEQPDGTLDGLVVVARAV